MEDASGFVVAATQHKLSEGTYVPEGIGAATIRQEGEYALITGEGFTYRFNTHYGRLEDLNGWLKTPMELTVWRAPTDNDRKIKEAWFLENYHKVHTKIYSVDIRDNTITVTGSLAPVSRLKFFTFTVAYTFYGNGQIDVTLEGEFDTRRAFLPRLGFSFCTEKMPFRYFGYGPLESYVDMHNGSRLGLYESTPEAEYVDYIMPQEHGNHWNTRYLEMGGFAFVAKQGFESNVSVYSAEELTEKNHNFELVSNGFANVRIDYKVSGIGSGSCGPQLLEKYRLQDETVSFKFSIIKL